MTVTVCTLEALISGPTGVEFSRGWLPSMVAERFVSSTKDGVVDRAPDPVTFIETDLTWTNNTDSVVHLQGQLHRGSRGIVTSNPNTVVLTDGFSYATGVSPHASVPDTTDWGFGGRLKTTSSAQASPRFSRLFLDADDSMVYVDMGSLAPGVSVHIRYACVLTTPQEWRVPNTPRHEAFARWARVRLFASPMLTAL